ncbi:hypothetical protein [Stenotrophomonas rhizophila]|uniref:hypothetical protein n=1 Tax=Stenotrophomonas rhizophila TaxID=216778 RepID=UPI0010BFF917|nr:hypothetical protein [Stenotrophomonas rhizophila]TKK09940.1 hypothetical protein SrhCFBP13529_07405 [Stenotrophomonas rhizophila]
MSLLQRAVAGATGGIAGVGALVVGLACSGITAVLATAMGAALLPRLLAPLLEAGMAPPALSAAFVSTYPWVWTGPVLVVLVAVFGGRLRYWLAGVVGMVSMLLWGSFAVLAMYLSLFVQAAAV